VTNCAINQGSNIGRSLSLIDIHFHQY